MFKSMIKYRVNFPVKQMITKVYDWAVKKVYASVILDCAVTFIKINYTRADSSIPLLVSIIFALQSINTMVLIDSM